MRDPKTRLAGMGAGAGLPPPTYDVVEQLGPDHAPVFRIAATVDGHRTALGEGRIEARAEQAAAKPSPARGRLEGGTTMATRPDSAA